MLTSPWFEVITRLDERIGSRLIKAGPAGNGTGGRGFMDRMSYILTKGSGTGRDCLQAINDKRLGAVIFYSPQSPTDCVDVITTG
jgi:hypothetical protein